MISAAPTIVALQTDSAWVVVLAVSLVTFPIVVLLRRFIARPGGLMSGILLALPLSLPLMAAAVFQQAVFPEFAVLRPADPAILRDPHLFLLHDAESSMLIPYRMIGVSGMWILVVAGLASLFLLMRRFVFAAAARNLMRRCIPARGLARERLTRPVQSISRELGLKRIPEVFVLPADKHGVFCSRRSGGQIFFSRELLRTLDDEELRAVIAHEVAHLRARDTIVTFIAGLLRDVVAWNPIAHMAHNRLLADREMEADRVAASVTGPLPVAAGLVKVCKAMNGRRSPAQSATMALLRPRRSVARRVRALLALADSPQRSLASEGTPYVLAALLAAILGLQVGAQLAEQEDGFHALVLGAPNVSSVSAWPSDEDVAARAELAGAASKKSGPKKALKEARRAARDARIASIQGAQRNGPYGFGEEELPRWLRTVASVASLRGSAGQGAVQDPPRVWRADLPRSNFGPISVVVIETEVLEQEALRKHKRPKPSDKG